MLLITNYFIILFADQKSELAFRCLVHMLPSPPRKGVKVPRLSVEVLMNQFFRDMEVCLCYAF